MEKRIEAYFETENDAESARAGLQRIRATNVIVDSIPEGDENKKYVPVVPFRVDSNPGVVSSGTQGTDGLARFAHAQEDWHDKGETKEYMTHMLQADVYEEDYDKAIDLLIRNAGYFEG